MDKYGLIGYPLGHSFSKAYFTNKFAQEGIDAVYDNYEIQDILQLPEIIKEEKKLRGLNVTIPHKRAVLGLLDTISDEAREIGAVNVIRIQRDRNGHITLHGYNSDIIGFSESIKPLLSQEKHKALVLGTGGASKAITLALTKLGIEWTYVSRKRQDGMYSYEDLTDHIIRSHKIIVNCSPVGMYPHVCEAPLIPYEAVGKEHLLYDLVYNPEVTEFMKRGSEQGATVKNGLEMLHLQAIASWELWNNESNIITKA